MEIDPVVAAVVGALVTVTGIYYRDLLKQLADAKAEISYWRDRYFGALARSELAADEAEKRKADAE